MTLIDQEKLASECSPYLDPAEIPDVSHLVTEDDTPVDNFFSEKQQRFLVVCIYDGWERASEKDFLASANVGVFPALKRKPLVPDMYLSLDVVPPDDPWPKSARSYFVWEHGKPPDVVIEVVSNRVGDERGRKHREYARMGVPYYAILDPLNQLGHGELQILELDLNLQDYRARDGWLPRVGLGLTIWEGEFEGLRARWLRWHRRDGSLLLTGGELARARGELAESEKQRAESEKQRADSEMQRADLEKQRADSEGQKARAERERADRLAEKLRSLGVDPNC